MSFDLSVVIPAYNRVELLKYTLQSVKHAIKDLKVEVIVVDDGSQEPLADQLKDFLDLPIHFICQLNQGSIIARSNGLKNAQGDYVLFLDSDDLVHPEKLVAQIACLNEKEADVCYTDTAVTNLQGNYESLVIKPSQVLPLATHPAEFYLKIQPSPHNPIYRKSYLQKYLENPLIPEDIIFAPVGDVWLFYNLAIYPAKIVKVDGYYTVVGHHNQDRYTQHWEKLGVASLALMLAFVENCPHTENTLDARKQVGECAFHTWRTLPRQYHDWIENKTLGIWRSSLKSSVKELGGRKFQLLAKLIGIENAAQIFKYIQRPLYSKIRTLSERELNNLLSLTKENFRLLKEAYQQ